MGTTALGTIQVGVSPVRNQDMARGMGRNLLEVLGVANLQQAMDALRARCNGTGTPNFAGLEVGDYLDGVNLGGVVAPNGGAAPAGSHRIIIAGFNFYKNAGDTSNNRNHIVFVFGGAIATGRMNPTNINEGGYAASEIRQWLEGAAGDGSGPLAVGLANAIGPLYTIRKRETDRESARWDSFTLWLPNEIEVYGKTVWGTDINHERADRFIMPVMALPIYQKSMEYVRKSRNGSRTSWWLSSPHADDSTGFCAVSSLGFAGRNTASHIYGLSPAFCVA